MQGLKNVLVPADILYDVFFLHSKEVSNERHFYRFKKYLQNYVSESGKPDVVIATDDNALLFLMKYGADVYADVPVVFCGINSLDRAISAGRDPLYTGVAEKVSLLDTLQVAGSLQPDLKTIYAISDATESGKESLKEYLSLARSIPTLDLKTLSLADMSFDDLRNTLQNPPDQSAFLLLSAYKDSDGNVLSFNEVMETLFTGVPAPVYHLWEHGIGQGLVGGRVVSQRVQAEVAALMAVEIIKGKSPDQIPVILESPNRYVFDKDVLTALNLAEEELPAGATLIGGKAGLALVPKISIVLTGVFIIVLAVVIALLVVNVIKRRTAEKKYKDVQSGLESRITQRTTELQAMNDSLRASMDNLHHTQRQLVEAEKMASLGELVAGVAHEINTPLGVGLTGISYIKTKVSSLKSDFESDALTKSSLGGGMADIHELADSVELNLNRAGELIQSFREVAVDQYFEERQEFDLSTYLHKAFLSLKPACKRGKHEIHLNQPLELMIKSYPGAFMQIFTNLVTNSMIHGFVDRQGGNISISVEPHGSFLHMIYKDDGKGLSYKEAQKVFDPFYTSKRGEGCTGLGMHIVYNLVTAKLGGTVECKASKDGACFIIEIPKASPNTEKVGAALQDAAGGSVKLHR
ncbi:MAG: ATP-binding protein [Desulfovibrio sp.]